MGAASQVAPGTMSTPGDRRILNSVVNPLLPLGEAVYDEREEGGADEDAVSEQEASEDRRVCPNQYR